MGSARNHDVPNITVETTAASESGVNQGNNTDIALSMNIPIPAATSTNITETSATEPSPSTLNRNALVALRRAHSLPGEKYRDTESFRSLNVPLILTEGGDGDS